MARLPRYEAGRVQAAGIGQIDFAGMREQARFSESIGKMAAFVDREIQEREIKRTKEEEEQNAAYQRIQADTLKTHYSIQVNDIIAQAKQSPELVSMDEVVKSLAELTDGFMASAESLDVERATFLQNDLLSISAIHTENYTTYHQQEAAKKLRAESIQGLNQIAINSELYSSSDSFSPEGVEELTAEAEQYALDHGYNPVSAAKEAQNLREKMLKNNAVYRYSKLVTLEDKENYINNLKITGLTIEDIAPVKRELESQLNQERRNFEVKVKTTRRTIQDTMTNLELGAQVSPEAMLEIQQNVDLYGRVDPSLQQDLDQLNFVAERFPALQNMSVADLAADVNTQRTAVSGMTTDNPDFRNKAAMLQASEELYKNMNAQLRSDPYGWYIRTGQLEVKPLVDQESIIKRQDDQDYMEGKNPGFTAPFLTTSEANNTVAALDKATKDGQLDVVVNELRAMQSLYGQNYETALQDLTKAGLASEYAVGGRYLGDKPVLAERIIGLSTVTPDELKKPLEAGKAKDFDMLYLDAMQEYSTAFTGGDITNAALKTLNMNYDVAKKLGYGYMNNTNTTALTAVEMVIEDMFPETVMLEDNAMIIVPRDANPNYVLSHLEEALEPSRLEQVGLAPLNDPNLPGYIDMAVDVESLSSDGVWLNNETGDGAVLHYNLNGDMLPVKLQDGNYYELKFNALSVFLNAPPRLDIVAAGGFL